MEITVEPHSHTCIHLTCTINPDLLGGWEELTDEMKAFWAEDGNVVPCEGNMGTGHWCVDCRYVGEIDIISD